jgi:hypothetical protein
MMREFGIRVQYLEEVRTDPEVDDYYRSRNDLFFAVHDDDVIPFTYPRASAGIHTANAAMIRGTKTTWMKTVSSTTKSKMFPAVLFRLFAWAGLHQVAELVGTAAGIHLQAIGVGWATDTASSFC